MYRYGGRNSDDVRRKSAADHQQTLKRWYWSAIDPTHMAASSCPPPMAPVRTVRIRATSRAVKIETIHSAVVQDRSAQPSADRGSHLRAPGMGFLELKMKGYLWKTVSSPKNNSNMT